MKHINLVLLFISFYFALHSQRLVPPTAQNHTCGFDHIHQEKQLSDPAYKLKNDAFNDKMLNFSMPKSGAQYQVPVVVHVLHKGEAIGTGTNISDEAVQNGIKWLNEYWRKVAGTNGDGGGVDMTIEFALAVRDPSGNCTNGIVRRDLSGTAYVNCGVNFPGSPGCGITDLEAKSGRWPTSQYYNIYLVDKIDNENCFADNSYVAGYAYMAGAHGFNYDGTIALTCSYISPSSITLAHELGHALNLYHTFEDNTTTCTTETNCATQGDRCCDTRPHRQTDCGGTGCTGSGTLLNSTRNYMSYCGDTERFTADQRTRSIAALTLERPSFLASNGNMSLVPPGLATVDFSASATAVCVGYSITFIDKSFCIPNTFTTTGYPNHTFSWTFSGPVILTSSEQSPSITFNTIGTYNVTLSITNNQGTFTETKLGYIEVASTPVAACIPTSFNPSGNYGFTVNNVTFNSINNSTSAIFNFPYTDFSCTHATVVEPGTTYPISITINATNNYLQYFEVYIDYNNDGIFQAGEKVFEGNSGTTNTSVTRTGSILIPATAVENTLLRMRVMGEVDGSPTAGNRACTTQFFVGDVEDYGVFIKPGCTPPAQPGAISGNVSVCENSTHSYSIAAVADATSYTWSVPVDATINSGQGSTNISVTFGASSGNISVTANDACGSGTARTQAITIATPTITSTTSGSRCGTGSVLLEASASAGTISWFANLIGGVALGTGNTFNTPSISTTTTYYIEANNGGCISSPRIAVDATINNISNQANLTLPLDASINVNVSPTFTWDAVADATSYDIQIATDVNFTNIVNSTTSATNSYTQTPALSTNSTYYWRVRATNSCGNGAYSSAFSFTTENFICNTYASTNVPITIPLVIATVTSTLNISDNITIDKLNVSNLVGTHTWISDLVISLTSPSGTTVILMNRVCSNQDNFNIKYDDDAPSATVPCPPVDGNYYRPNQPLSAFNGESSQGIWTLTIQDLFDQDGGFLNGWSLYICGSSCSTHNTTENMTSCDPADEGVFVTNHINQFGCDSVHTRTVTLSPSDNTTENLTSCNPADTGVFVFSGLNQYGCDSINTRTVTLLPSSSTFQNLTSCNPADTGIFVFSGLNQYGCDSIDTRTVTLLPSSGTFQNLTSCNPADTGIFVFSGLNQFGCDSIDTRTVTLLPSSSTFQNLNSCNPADTGIFVFSGLNQFGCDSINTRIVSLLSLDSTFQHLTSCSPADTGVFVFSGLNQFGCDSMNTRTVTLLLFDSTFQSLTSCNPADTGVFVFSGLNQFGCDSIDTRTVTLLPSSNTFQNLTSCNPADTGVFVFSGLNQFGCDSIDTRTVTLLPSSNTFQNLTSCNPVDTGVFVFSGLNQFGCDSIDTRTVTLLPSSSTFQSLTSCNPADTGVFVFSGFNQFGCDSIHTRTVTLSLLSNTPGTITGNTEICQGSTHNYNINNVPDALAYSWSIPPDATLISGQGTTSITVQFGITGGVIGVTANNNCGTSAQQTLAVNVSTNQAPIINIESVSGNTSICYGTDINFIAFYTFGGNNPDLDWQINGISTGINSDTFTGSNLSNGDVVSCVITSSNVCATPQSASSNSMVMNVTELNEDVDTTGNILAAIETGASYRWFDCDNNSFISGETGQSFTPVASGNYSVEITKNNCSVISDCYEIEISTQVSIKEIDFNHIKLYPNPNSGIFYIEFDKVVNELNTTITDAIGKIIYMDDFKNTGKISMNIEPASGIYFLKLRNATGNTKVIKFTIY